MYRLLINKLLACILKDSYKKKSISNSICGNVRMISFVLRAYMETCFLFIACVVFYTAQSSEGRKIFSVLVQYRVMHALIILSEKKVKMSLSA